MEAASEYVLFDTAKRRRLQDETVEGDVEEGDSMQLTSLFISILILFVSSAIIKLHRNWRSRKERQTGSVKNKDIPSVRERLSHYLKVSTDHWRNFEFFQAFLNATYILMYLIDVNLTTARADTDQNWPLYVELFYTVAFGMDYAINLFLSPNRLGYMWSFYALCDFFSVVPSLVAFVEGAISKYSFFRIVRLVRLARLPRLFRMLRIMRVLHSMNVIIYSHFDAEAVVKRKLIHISFTMASLCLWTTGVLHVLEEDVFAQDPIGEDGWWDPTFFHVLYFIVVTISTVGYGDYSPKTEIGMIMVIFLILSIFLIIPNQINELATLMALRPVTVGNLPTRNTRGHVILTGAISDEGVREFLREFFHEDRDFQKNIVVIVGHQAPSFNLKALLMHPVYEAKVSYLQGSIMNDRDLKQIHASTAQACFILADRFNENRAEEDANIVLKTWAFRNIVDDIPLFIQLHFPHTKAHVHQRMLDGAHDRIVCISEMRMAMLAQAVRIPGCCTLIANLIQSAADADLENLDEDHNWNDEYSLGKAFEVYDVELAAYVGQTLGEACKVIFTEFHAVLFAVEQAITKVRPIALFPSPDYVIRQEDVGFVMAADRIIAHHVEEGPTSRRLVQRASFRDVFSTNAARAQAENALKSRNRKYSVDTRLVNEENAVDGVLLEEVDLLTLKEWTNVHDCKVDTVPFRDHVLVCGFSSGLKYFIRAFRRTNQTQFRPIVIMVSVAPTETEWVEISQFRRVYWMVGEKTNWVDLDRARAADSSAIVMLCSSQTEATESGEAVQDAENLLGINIIEREFHWSNTILVGELLDLQSSKFLGQNADLPESSSSAHFAAGNVFSILVLDSLLSQTFFNPAINCIVQLLVSGGVTKGLKRAARQQGMLRLRDVESRFIGHNYHYLFETLLSNGYLSLGLFRFYPGMTGGKKFVMTNPPQSSILREGDQVYVVGPREREVSNYDDADWDYLEVPKSERPSKPALSRTASAVAIGEERVQKVLRRGSNPIKCLENRLSVLEMFKTGLNAGGKNLLQGKFGDIEKQEVASIQRTLAKLNKNPSTEVQRAKTLRGVKDKILAGRGSTDAVAAATAIMLRTPTSKPLSKVLPKPKVMPPRAADQATASQVRRVPPKPKGVVPRAIEMQPRSTISRQPPVQQLSQQEEPPQVPPTKPQQPQEELPPPGMLLTASGDVIRSRVGLVQAEESPHQLSSTDGRTASPIPEDVVFDLEEGEELDPSDLAVARLSIGSDELSRLPVIRSTDLIRVEMDDDSYESQI